MCVVIYRRLCITARCNDYQRYVKIIAAAEEVTNIKNYYYYLLIRTGLYDGCRYFSLCHCAMLLLLIDNATSNDIAVFPWLSSISNTFLLLLCNRVIVIWLSHPMFQLLRACSICCYLQIQTVWCLQLISGFEIICLRTVGN